MVYCNPGDKPTVKYKFAGQNEKTYKSEYAPIEVITKSNPISATNNYNKLGFNVQWKQFSNSSMSSQVCKDFETFYVPNYISVGVITFLTCSQADWETVADCSQGIFGYTNCRSGFYWDGTNPTVLSTPNCGGNPRDKCSIQIIYNGLTIFQDQGDCPITFSVSCGNCPPGTEEHKSDIYPGYCCLDCAGVANEIRGITNTVRGLNRG